MGDETDEVYVQQLKEVFNSCDLQDKGYLDRNELIDLGQKLHIADQVPKLLKDLIGSEHGNGKVYFNAFRLAFIKVLEEIDNFQDLTTEEEQSEWSDLGESFTSLQLSRQFSIEEENARKNRKSSSVNNEKGHRGQFTRKTSTPNYALKERTQSPNKLRLRKELKYETPASPVYSESNDLFSPDVISLPSTEADVYRKAWVDAVGEIEYIALPQLSSICELVGVEKMDENQLEFLFQVLDADNDGLISFPEFANGLSKIMKDKTDGSSNEKKKNGVKRSKSKQQAKSNEVLSFLDTENSGYVNAEQLKNHFYKIVSRKQLLPLWKGLSFDNRGRISLVKLSECIDNFLVENSDALTNSLFSTFNMEIAHLRGQIDVSRAELELCKANLSKLDLYNASLIREGEEYEQKNKALMKSQAQTFAERLSNNEKELIRERDSMLQAHQKDIRTLEEKFDQLQADDGKTKAKLKDATNEILRLEDSLKNTLDELNLERKRSARLEKEMGNANNLKDKICDLESQVSAVTDYRDKQRNQIKELEMVNKQLRDQNDEFLVQIESYSNTSRRSQQSRMGSPETDSMSRNGSYLSDYVKPNVIKRNEFGDSCDDDQIIAVSESGVYAIGNMDELQMKITDQEAIITSLRRDLEMVNKLLEDNSSTNSERHSREISRLSEKFSKEISDLKNIMSKEKEQLQKGFSREKEDLINKYEDKLEKIKRERDQYEKDRWEMSSDTGSDVSFRKERRKMEHLFREEKEEIEMNFRSQITKLEEKVVILETEKAEIELKFLNEKAELEQQFRIERAELQQNATSTSREYDRSKKYIDFLKDDLQKKHIRDMEDMERSHKRDKHSLSDKHENEISDMTKQHHKELGNLRKSFNHQIGELEKTFNKERASMKESFMREKSEIEQKFLREKTELEDTLKQDYDHNLSVRLANVRKQLMEEKAEIEERLRDEKYQLSKEMQMAEASHEREIKQLKSELELNFAEEKARMKEDFEYEKSQIENRYIREISHLQQAFSGGEAGLKGKMKEDFTNLIHKYKREWQTSFEKEKTELLDSFAREKSQLEESWLDEKQSMEENFEREKMEIESVFLREKQELLNKYQSQRDSLENEYREENEKLKSNRDTEINFRVQRETELLRNAAEHLEKEVVLLREQKKELETKNQILELKSLSQKQEAEEIKQIQKERKRVDEKVNGLQEEVRSLNKEKEKLDKELKDMAREKSTILDNSVQEITEQQERISRLQSEKETLQEKIEQLLIVEKEAENLKMENMRVSRECKEKQKNIESLSQVKEENIALHEDVRRLEEQERDLEANIQDKALKVSRLEEELEHCQKKMESIEEIHKKECDAIKDRLNMQTTAAATEKSRFTRELQELKDHLNRANASSDRDTALKQKVFNDAKEEVMNLNKKLDEKTRKIRSLEEALKSMEGKLVSANKDRDDLNDVIKELKAQIREIDMNLREEKKGLAKKSLRSDTLVTDLYLENADLMKQLANAESDKVKSDKLVRQLTDQKRALQRVISKLCHANGIANPTSL